MARRALQRMVLILAATVLLSPSFSAAAEKMETAKLSAKTVDLRLALRDLWAGHIFWVRNVVVDTKYNDPAAAKVAEEQVVQNARSIADSISPYYGKEAADKLFSLLAAHYGGVREYMSAAFVNDTEGKNSAKSKLEMNAADIATFLSSANPNWPKDALLSALIAHRDHHMAQILAVNVKDYSLEARTWQDMKNHIYAVADILADGIVKQFPGKF